MDEELVALLERYLEWFRVKPIPDKPTLLIKDTKKALTKRRYAHAIEASKVAPVN